MQISVFLRWDFDFVGVDWWFFCESWFLFISCLICLFFLLAIMNCHMLRVLFLVGCGDGDDSFAVIFHVDYDNVVHAYDSVSPPTHLLDTPCICYFFLYYSYYQHHYHHYYVDHINYYFKPQYLHSSSPVTADNTSYHYFYFVWTFIFISLRLICRLISGVIHCWVWWYN